MLRSIVILLLSSLLLVVPVTGAQARSKAASTLYQVPGKCRALIVSGDRLTQSCVPLLGIVEIKAGIGGGIVVPVKPFGTVNFYVDSVRPGKARLLAVEVTALPVAKKRYAVPVGGECRIGNYLKASARIACTGRDINGLPFKLEFVTGRPRR